MLRWYIELSFGFFFGKEIEQLWDLIIFLLAHVVTNYINCCIVFIQLEIIIIAECWKDIVK